MSHARRSAMRRDAPPCPASSLAQGTRLCRTSRPPMPESRRPPSCPGARPMPRMPAAAAAGSLPSRSRRRAANSSATATVSSIRPPSAVSPIRRRSSSRTRAIITAPGSPIRSKSARSPARSPARSASTTISPRRWRWRTISATRLSAIPARMRSTRLMRPYGGFDHNAQALRIVTKLEHRYAAFDGLNLTWETLEGLVKHNGPLLGPDGQPIGALCRARPAGGHRSNMTTMHDLRLDLFAERRGAGGGASPTISPITRMTSTMACAPGCSISRRSAEVDYLRERMAARSSALHPGLERQRASSTNWSAALITDFIEDAIAESAARLDGEPRCERRRRAARGPAVDRLFARRCAGARAGDQEFPVSEYVSPSAHHPHPGRGRGRRARSVRRFSSRIRS